jgi:purine-binding chemotaxis protein CheW
MDRAMSETISDKVAGKYLGFRLAGEDYGLPILSVHEIIGMQPITLVPRAPSHIRGVINLRGKIVPVVDLRVKFDMMSSAGGELCIVVVRAAGNDMGILVDAVSEVLDVKLDDVAATPDFGQQIDASFVKGISRANGKVRFLLDIDAILGPPPGDRAAAGGAIPFI